MGDQPNPARGILEVCPALCRPPGRIGVSGQDSRENHKLAETVWDTIRVLVTEGLANKENHGFLGSCGLR